MLNDIDWVTTCVTKACNSNIVPIAVSNKLKGLLDGKLCEQQLSAVSVAKIASELITAMVSADYNQTDQE